MRTNRRRLGRTTRTALLSALVIAAPLTIGTGTAQAATTTPVSGAACGVDDLGRRGPEIVTYQVDPVVTHFLAINVASGTNTEQTYQLQVTDAVMSSVAQDYTLEAAFSLFTIIQAKAVAHVNVTKQNTHTEVTTVGTIWRFLNPGYYGLYKGVLKVTGTVNSLHCLSVADATGARSLRWVPRPAGTFTMFGDSEQGSVRCEERYPASTVRTAARTTLCGNVTTMANPAAAATALNAALKRKGDVAVAAAKKEIAARLAAQKAAQLSAQKAGSGSPGASAGVAATAVALPTSMTCDPGYLRLLTSDKALAVGVDSAGTGVVLRATSAGNVTHWQDCHTSGTYPQHVLIARDSLQTGSPRCLDMMSAGMIERAPVQLSPCTYRVNQRFSLYTDPATSAAGLQSVASGSMIAPLPTEPLEDDGLGQFSVGRDDGLGTFYAEQVA